MYINEVFVTNSSLNVNQLYSYYSLEYIKPYKRVNVTFAHSKTLAIVIKSYEIESLENKEKELGFKLSKINNVIDDEPIINDYQFELAKWLSFSTVSPFISCLNAMLPKALRTSKSIKKPREIEYVRKIEGEFAFTSRQEEIYNQVIDGMLAKELREKSTSIFKKLIDLKAIEVYFEEKKYIQNEEVINTSFKKLTNDQENVFNSILNTDKLVSLIFGITGSGKTEVYLHLAREYLSKGKEVLILVPEISLTPQMIQRVKERFNDVVFYHSELNDQERYEQYQRVKNQEVKIVVGTRSSIFLPFHQLGLIIIDEEHDNSYVQDNTPCYSAISVAKKIAYDSKAKLVLASATPSLDSYTRGLKGDYQLLTLDKRINNQLPDIEIVDLVSEVKNHNSYIISKTLQNEIDNCLQNHKQAIILLNRRGYSPIIKCSECTTTLMCSNCDVPLNYHKDENILKCHQCGKTYPVKNICPKCGSHKLIYYGFGTKKVQEELNRIYPNINVERMDRDNVSKKGSHKEILERFEKHEIDILVGTQMIAKGLDYPDVTLVGILNGDAGLMHQDYNASKMTFDLLMQASGRSGRASDKGKCIIQAFNKDHYVLKAVLSQDYNYFYNIEMNYRSKMKYPPYSHLVEIVLSDNNPKSLETSLNYLNSLFVDTDIKIYRAIDLGKVNGLYRKRILMMDSSSKKLIEFSWLVIDNYLKQKNKSKIKIDIDPLYIE